ncbi:MAG: SRPBCC family protein [Hyphomonadaceae bacterium]
MTKTIAIAPVKKSLIVETDQAHAFEVFTAGLDRWWPKEHHIGESPVAKSIIEPRLGGRWYSLHQDGKEVTTGHMTVWDPPKRIVFTWEINGQWKPESNPKFASEVEVRFIAEGPSRTRVELNHYNFERMPDVEGAKGMRNGVDNGWPGILEVYRKVAQS